MTGARPKLEVMLQVASGRTADPDYVLPLARAIEDLGFDGVGAVEHTVVSADYSSRYPYDPSAKMPLAATTDMPDPLELLAIIAGATSRITLSTGVLVLPNHHPVVLAKRLATLDRLTGGRFRIAVGVGWMREEIEACGVDFSTRGRRADEQLAVMSALWTGADEGVDFDGEFFTLDRAVCRPAPVTAGGPPIHIGGHSKAAARRAGRYARGLQPLGAKSVDGDEIPALMTQMREAAVEAGRDPEVLELTMGHAVTVINAERLDRLAALGADRVVLAMSDSVQIERQLDELAQCADRLGLAPVATAGGHDDPGS